MDLPEQTPFKQKSRRKCLNGVCCLKGVWRWTCQSKLLLKCLKGVWRWTCQSKLLLSRNQAERFERGLAVDLPEQYWFLLTLSKSMPFRMKTTTFKICWYLTAALIRFRRRNRSTGYLDILPLRWSDSGARTGHLKWKGKDFAAIYIDAGSGAGTRHTSNEIIKDEQEQE